MSTIDSKFSGVERLESSLPTRPIRFPHIRGGVLTNLRISGGAIYQDGSIQLDGSTGIDQVARIRFDGSKGTPTVADFSIETRTVVGPGGQPRPLSRPEEQSLLNTLQSELKSPHPSINQEVIRQFAGKLAQALGQPAPSTVFNGVRFGQVERAADGGLTAQLGVGVDLTGTLHVDGAGKITYAQHMVAMHPGMATPLSTSDRTSLELNLEKYIQSQDGHVNRMWNELLTDLKNQI